MLSFNAFMFFSALLLAAALCEPLAKSLRLPFTIILVIIGFVGSEFATKILHIDTGIRWENFHWFIFYMILPVLIFHAGIGIHLQSLKENILPILILAIPLMLISTGIIAVVIYYGIGFPSGFPWIAALLAGALLSATDPAAVISLLQRVGAPKRLALLLEGESMFNDATAIVLFSIIIAIAQAGGESAGTWAEAVIRFLIVFVGGIAIGLFTGLLGHFLIKLARSKNSFVLITVIVAYISYLVAELQFHVSGVMAVLAAGVLIGAMDKQLTSKQDNQFMTRFWSFLAWFAELLIFLLAGISITLSMFKDQWLAMLIGIGAVLIARLMVILLGFPVINRLPGIEPLPFRQQLVMTWGGVRGTVTLALALSLPLSLSYWYTIQSIAYGVVLFTLFFQTTTMSFLVKKLNIREGLA